MGVETKALFETRQISNAGAFLAGSSNNGSHTPNGLAAMFIATGQDVADISESQAAVTYSQLLENGDYYWSVTLTSLIVGTVGGGTGLATQRECLEMLGCHGQGKADKFAEICAGVALAGETSLASAVLSGDWVSSHERLDGATRRSHPQLDRAKDRASSRGVFAAVHVAQHFPVNLVYRGQRAELRQSEDRLHDLTCDHVEGDELADRHRAFDHRLRAEEQDQRRQ